MKNPLTLTGTSIASTLSLHGATVLPGGFDTPLSATSNIPLVLGTSAPDIEVTGLFGAGNGEVMESSQLTLNSSVLNRFRGAGVCLDATGRAAGLVTVGVDVTTFSPGANISFLFHAYSVNGVYDANGESLDPHSGVTTGATFVGIGGGTIDALCAYQKTTGLGITVPFTFDYNGSGQFVGLTFAQSNSNNPSGSFGSVSFDNLTVDTVPEPSTGVVFGTGLLLRCRRWEGRIAPH